MKNLFGINMTAGADDESQPIDEFIYKRISEELEKKLEEQLEDLNVISKKATLPRSVGFIKYALYFLGLICLMLIANIDSSLANAYATTPYLFWLAGVALIIAVVITVYTTTLYIREYTALIYATSEAITI